MESLKYCLLLATVIGYVVAKNPTLPFQKFPGFPEVKGTVSKQTETKLKIQGYQFPRK